VQCRGYFCAQRAPPRLPAIEGIALNALLPPVVPRAKGQRAAQAQPFANSLKKVAIVSFTSNPSRLTFFATRICWRCSTAASTRYYFMRRCRPTQGHENELQIKRGAQKDDAEAQRGEACRATVAFAATRPRHGLPRHTRTARPC